MRRGRRRALSRATALSSVVLALTLVIGLIAAPSAVLIVAPTDPTVDAAARAALAPHVSLLSTAKTAELMTQAKSVGLTCVLVEEACAASFGALAQVDEVIVVRVEHDGDTWVHAVRERVSEGGRVTARVVGRIEASERGAAGFLALLYGAAGPQPFVPVDVELKPPGARLIVDGAPVAVVKGRAWIRAGRHAASAEADGFVTGGMNIDVPTDGTATRLVLTLAAVPPKAPPAASSANDDVAAARPPSTTPLPPAPESSSPMPIAALAGGAVVAGLGTVAWVWADNELGKPQLTGTRDAWTAAGLSGVALVLVGATGAVVGAVMLAGDG